MFFFPPPTGVMIATSWQIHCSAICKILPRYLRRQVSLPRRHFFWVTRGMPLVEFPHHPPFSCRTTKWLTHSDFKPLFCATGHSGEPSRRFACCFYFVHLKPNFKIGQLYFFLILIFQKVQVSGFFANIFFGSLTQYMMRWASSSLSLPQVLFPASHPVSRVPE